MSAQTSTLGDLSIASKAQTGKAQAGKAQAGKAQAGKADLVWFISLGMLSIQRRGTGVLLTWCFIGVAVLYCVYVIGKSVFIGNYYMHNSHNYAQFDDVLI